MAVALVARRSAARPRRPGSRARCGGRSGRAAPRAAGTCPRARSGSRSRAGGTGCGSSRVTPSTVTWPLGHRLEQRRLRLRHRAVDLVDEQDVGEDRAGPELEVPRSSGRRSTRPVTSVGCRSGVHWMRATSRRPRCCRAIARASIVFAVPGTSSSSTCPSQMSAARTSLISSRLPWTTVSMLSRNRVATRRRAGGLGRSPSSSASARSTRTMLSTGMLWSAFGMGVTPLKRPRGPFVSGIVTAGRRRIGVRFRDRPWPGSGPTEFAACVPRERNARSQARTALRRRRRPPGSPG